MNCTIRPWLISDAANLSLALNNPLVMNNLRDGLPFPYTKEDALFFINSMLSSNKNDTFPFAISVNHVAIGSIGAFRKDNIHSHTAEMGYYISQDYWGKGIATCAVKQLCEYVFHNTDIIRIFAEPFSHNTASCRVLEKAGFSYEGTLRKNAIKNGAILDMKMYSILKNESIF